MSSCVSGRMSHAADVALEPHHRRLADLQVKVGRLVLHDHAEELVDFGLACGLRGGTCGLVVLIDAHVERGAFALRLMLDVVHARADVAARGNSRDRHAALGQVGLGRGDAVFVVMEDAGGQGGVGPALGQHLKQVLGTSPPRRWRRPERRRPRRRRASSAGRSRSWCRRRPSRSARSRRPRVPRRAAPRRRLPGRSARGRR